MRSALRSERESQDIRDIADLRQRRVMTTYDPDTIEQDRSALYDIVERVDATLALNCAVAIPERARPAYALPNHSIRPRTKMKARHVLAIAGSAGALVSCRGQTAIHRQDDAAHEGCLL